MSLSEGRVPLFETEQSMAPLQQRKTSAIEN